MTPLDLSTDRLNDLPSVPGRRTVGERAFASLRASGLDAMTAAGLAIRAEFGPPDWQTRPTVLCGCRRDGKGLCVEHRPQIKFVVVG